MSDWDQRQLCSDGSCIGVIGADGRCKVCGRVAQGWGDERSRGLATDEDAADEDEDDDEDDEDGDEYEDDDEEDAEEDPIVPGTPARLGEAADWHARKLCPDGSCIGVIGADGRCKVCGKRADVKAASAPIDPLPVVAPANDEVEAVAEQMSRALDAAGDAPAEERTLCSDESCIGVLGLDGRCKVCGKPGAS